MADQLKEKEFYAIVEVMGHQKFAGLVSEHVIAGQAFIRVDVPEIPTETQGEGVDRIVIQDGIPGFTKLLGPSSIYAMSPVSEEVARHVAKSLRQRVLQPWEMPKNPQRKLLPVDSDYDADDEDDGRF